MSVAPLPPQYAQLGERPFSFYPAIFGIEHNEWRFGRATWSEIEVRNAKSGLDLWIPRRFFGEVSPVGDPVVIVGLTKELEFRAGAVWPRQKRVIELPSVPAPPAETAAPPSPVPMAAAIRLESPTEQRVGRLILATLAVLGVALFVLVLVTREKTVVPRVSYTNRDQAFLELRYQDDYHAVIHRLGQPASVRERMGSAEIQYRVLDYPGRGYSVVLMGGDKDSLRYIGAMDREWHVIHFVQRPDGRDTAPLLRSLRRF
jgi:hypothetical protein